MGQTRMTGSRFTAVLLAAGVAACSQSPGSLVSPSAVAGPALADTAPAATLKVSPPIPVSPVGGVTIEGRKPTFIFQNAAGKFVAPDQGVYEVELYGPGETLIARHGVPGDPGGGTSIAHPEDLAWETTFTWRVRLTLAGAASEWSAPASFRTPDEPKAGNLPFEVPASCGPRTPPTGDRSQCARDVASVSPEWPGCRAGSGVRCHRFTRHLAAALATGDPRWGLITKNPNEQQCSWDACGPSVRGGYGEDVVAFRHGPSDFDWEGWDVVTGAGAPGANVNWTRLSSRRPGNNWAPVPPFP